MNTQRRVWVLVAILVVAAVLRIGWLSRGDTMSDEVFYGFRAIGPMDFDEAADQTTPLEWFDGRIPWWSGLSFHDHPPLVFWLQHVSTALFGENNFGLRFQSALFGIASVYLLYLLGWRLYSERVGLFAAAIFAATINHVYISRLGMQEAYVIFFLLLGSYWFLRALDDRRYWWGAGAAIGLGFLTKYTALILVPVFLTYIAVFRRDCFRQKTLWFGVLAALALASPVIVYNAMLYAAVGHFDFQLSFIVGQHPAAWSTAPGKDIGTLAERIGDFFPRLIATQSWLFLALFAVSIGFLWFRERKSGWRAMARRYAFLDLSIAWLLLLLLKIGPAYRFLTLLTPYFALVLAAGFESLKTRLPEVQPRVWITFFSTIFAFELFYTANNLIAYYPLGSAPWVSSRVRYESYNWGYNALAAYFEREFSGKMPALAFDMQYQFLEDMRGRFLKQAKAAGKKPYPALVVTYGNFDRGAKLWTLDRLQIYHGWPMLDLEAYFTYLRENGREYYERAGFREYYYVLHTATVPTPEFRALVRDLPYESIRNPRGDEMARVYRKSQ